MTKSIKCSDCIFCPEVTQGKDIACYFFEEMMTEEQTNCVHGIEESANGPYIVW